MSASVTVDLVWWPLTRKAPVGAPPLRYEQWLHWDWIAHPRQRPALTDADVPAALAVVASALTPGA